MIKSYFDNAATTAVDPEVFRAMEPYFEREYGNASSLHQAGLDNRVAVDRAQAKIAKFLAADKVEVYFTSGATESDNLAVLGLIRAVQGQQPGKSVQIITSAIEHDAILEPCRHLAQEEGVEAVYLPVGSDGLVKVSDVLSAITEQTVLVSIMLVNNEIGTIQPIKEIGAALAKINKKRRQKIYFHTDATQALSYVDCRVTELGVDLLSLSGHKIYGPKGVGALYLRAGTPLQPLFFGGHQQQNVRPGTYNVPGIVGLGAAIELLDNRPNSVENLRLKKMRDYLLTEILRLIPRVSVNGSLEQRTPNNLNLTFAGVEGESVVLMLSEQGLAASTGSACSSGSLDPSHVLTAIGLPPELAHGSLRLTLGRFTEQKHLDYLLQELPPIIERLRKMSPLK